MAAAQDRNPGPSGEAESDDRYRLDPAKFPRRLELELSEPLMRHLEERAARSGRSVNDLISELLCQQIEPVE